MIQQAFDLLKTEKGYANAKVKEKMETLGTKIAKATITNILNGKGASQAFLQNQSTALSELILIELGHVWDGTKFTYQLPPNCRPNPVPTTLANSLSLAIKPGFAFQDDGRLEVREKVAFMQLAKKEVIELGVTLNCFSQYFAIRSDA